MDILKQWLLGVTGTTLILAITESLMPTGPVKQVGKLISGLILLLMIINPILQFSPDTLAQLSKQWQSTLQEESITQENYYNKQLKLRIESNLEAYIVDKAMEMGISCQPIVYCSLDENGIYLPTAVDIGSIFPEERELLVKFISEDLGIEQTAIHGKEVAHENMENPTHQPTLEVSP